MPVNLKVEVDELRLKEQIARLERIYTESTIRRISKELTPFAQRALAFLKVAFPSSDRNSHSISDTQEFGMHLVSGWRVHPIVETTSAGFAIEHVLGDSRRASTVLESLETGWANRLVAKTGDLVLLLFGRKPQGQFITLKEGRQTKRRVGKGTYYRQRTFEYVQNVLFPQMQAVVVDQVRKVVENG